MQHQGLGLDETIVPPELEKPSGTQTTPEQGRLTLLLAEQGDQPAGYAELIEVETLLYRGVWIESLVAPVSRVRTALLQEAVQWARAAGLDEVGAMVPERDWALQHALLASGFRSLGDFRWFSADLPLPDTTAGSQGEKKRPQTS